MSNSNSIHVEFQQSGLNTDFRLLFPSKSLPLKVIHLRKISQEKHVRRMKIAFKQREVKAQDMNLSKVPTFGPRRRLTNFKSPFTTLRNFQKPANSLSEPNVSAITNGTSTSSNSSYPNGKYRSKYLSFNEENYDRKTKNSRKANSHQMVLQSKKPLLFKLVDKLSEMKLIESSGNSVVRLPSLSKEFQCTSEVKEQNTESKRINLSKTELKNGNMNSESLSKSEKLSTEKFLQRSGSSEINDKASLSKGKTTNFTDSETVRRTRIPVYKQNEDYTKEFDSQEKQFQSSLKRGSVNSGFKAKTTATNKVEKTLKNENDINMQNIRDMTKSLEAVNSQRGTMNSKKNKDDSVTSLDEYLSLCDTEEENYQSGKITDDSALVDSDDYYLSAPESDRCSLKGQVDSSNTKINNIESNAIVNPTKSKCYSLEIIYRDNESDFDVNNPTKKHEVSKQAKKHYNSKPKGRVTRKSSKLKQSSSSNTL